MRSADSEGPTRVMGEQRIAGAHGHGRPTCRPASTPTGTTSMVGFNRAVGKFAHGIFVELKNTDAASPTAALGPESKSLLGVARGRGGHDPDKSPGRPVAPYPSESFRLSGVARAGGWCWQLTSSS